MIYVVLGVVVISALAIGSVVAKLHYERKLREKEREVEENIRYESEKRIAALVEGALEKFKVVSNTALKTSGEEFKALNAVELERILKPLKESVAEYQASAVKSQEKTDRLEIKLGEHMRELGLAAEKFNTGSTSFVNAITGGNKVAGNWGEAVLDQVLADCGLIRDVHYLAQAGGTGNIPDYQVFDAASKKILVIDSKVSWKKFKELSESVDPKVKEQALIEHIESIYRQIDILSGKKYQENPNPPRPGFQYLPFSAMFIPSDAALWEAVKRDPELPGYAYKKNVVLITPTSLLGFLKLIHEGWSLYNTQRNQEEIAKQANILVERIDKLFKCLEDANLTLTKAQEKIDEVLKLASTEAEGRCIKGPALKIIKLRDSSEKLLKSKTLIDATVD